MNGSSATGNCSSVTFGTAAGQFRSLSRCNAPTSGVLFDDNIPTLTGLDGDMWASQLLSRCNAPTSGVLFDDNIPTLTGLDGDMWASQLLTLQITTEIVSDFTDTPGYARMERVELVMFNCPEWGVAVQAIRLLIASSECATLKDASSAGRVITVLLLVT